jgi:hypothetical protein
MADLSQIQPDAEIVGADGVHLGTVDRVDGDRITLTRNDSSDGRHHFIDAGLIATVDGAKVWLSANADVVLTVFEDSDPTETTDDERLDEGLEETFPASDPVSAKHIT